MELNRKNIAELIFNKINSQKEELKEAFVASKTKIGYFFVDDLLPEDLAQDIYSKFPKPENMKQKRTLREYKYIAAQMDQYDPLLEEVIYAFQEKKVVDIFKEICGIPNLFPDDNLYAGGLSLMGYENYLNPHLDNSHDKDRNLWRVLNLLYYVTPDWQDENGGHLEIWPDGLKKDQTIIHSRFNRLAIMATHQRSWHSVSPVTFKGVRCCVSNYYFSPEALTEEDRFHVTSFRGRPGQVFGDLVLQADSGLRSALRKIFKKGIRENPHVYKKDN